VQGGGVVLRRSNRKLKQGTVTGGGPGADGRFGVPKGGNGRKRGWEKKKKNRALLPSGSRGARETASSVPATRGTFGKEGEQGGGGSRGLNGFLILATRHYQKCKSHRVKTEVVCLSHGNLRRLIQFVTSVRRR